MTYSTFIKKRIGGLGIILRNVEDRAVVKGFTTTFQEIYCNSNDSAEPEVNLVQDGQTLSPKDIRCGDIVISVNSVDIQSGNGFNAIIEALRAANDTPNYSMQSYMAAVTAAAGGGSYSTLGAPGNSAITQIFGSPAALCGNATGDDKLCVRFLAHDDMLCIRFARPKLKE